MEEWEKAREGAVLRTFDVEAHVSRPKSGAKLQSLVALHIREVGI
jgi:hypothetical protein